MGANLFFASAGAVLEVVGVSLDDALIAAWRGRVERAGTRLSWINRQTVARLHTGGASLAIAAPYDQLFLATEVNEWALCAAMIERDPVRWSGLEAALIAQALQASENAASPRSEEHTSELQSPDHPVSRLLL